MGTRHMIGVINKDGQKVVGQYAQWDGYFEGQGKRLIHLLNQPDFLKDLEAALPIVRFLDRTEKDKQMVEEYDRCTPRWSNEPDNRTQEMKDWYSNFMHRDLSVELLVNIIKAHKDGKTEVIVDNQFDFMLDSLFCEYAYVINFQRRQFEVYCGFIHKPHEENPYYDGKVKHEDDYYPVRQVLCYGFEDIPTLDGWKEIVKIYDKAMCIEQEDVDNIDIFLQMLSEASANAA